MDQRGKLQEKEFFALRSPEIANAPNAAARKRMIEKLKEYWQKFGLGEITGIDLPGENSGFLADPGDAGNVIGFIADQGLEIHYLVRAHAEVLEHIL